MPPNLENTQSTSSTVIPPIPSKNNSNVSVISGSQVGLGGSLGTGTGNLLASISPTQSGKLADLARPSSANPRLQEGHPSSTEIGSNSLKPNSASMTGNGRGLTTVNSANAIGNPLSTSPANHTLSLTKNAAILSPASPSADKKKSGLSPKPLGLSRPRQASFLGSSLSPGGLLGGALLSDVMTGGLERSGSNCSNLGVVNATSNTNNPSEISQSGEKSVLTTSINRERSPQPNATDSSNASNAQQKNSANDTSLLPSSKTMTTAEARMQALQEFTTNKTQFLYTVSESAVCQTICAARMVSCVFHLDVPPEMLSIYALRLLVLDNNSSGSSNHSRGGISQSNASTARDVGPRSSVSHNNNISGDTSNSMNLKSPNGFSPKSPGNRASDANSTGNFSPKVALSRNLKTGGIGSRFGSGGGGASDNINKDSSGTNVTQSNKSSSGTNNTTGGGREGVSILFVESAKKVIPDLEKMFGISFMEMPFEFIPS